MAIACKLSLCGLTACLLPLVAFAAAAPPTPPPAPAQPETFYESVDVQVVNVEVYVTDRDGKRVHGLKREDFELSEDGKPVTITNFLSVDAALTSPAGAAAGGAIANAGTSTGSSTPPPGASIPPAATPPNAEQRLYLAIFLDEASLTVQARNRLLPAIKSFVAGKLRPDDRLLLASYNGSVRILQGPTADPAAINTALEQVAKGSPRGTERAIDRRRVLGDIDQARNVDSVPGGPERAASALEEATETYEAVRLLAQTGYDEVRATTAALGQFVDSLAGLPGRKAVLLVSGGLSERPGETLFTIWQNKFARFALQVGASKFDAFRNDTTRLFEDLVERANANRVTFYTLAAPEDLTGRTADTAGDDNITPDLAGIDDLNQVQPLQILAGATGGVAAVDKTGVLFERLRTDLDTYYSLGYLPTHPKDGKKHRLRVKVRDHEVKVRTREGYRERTGPELTASHTLSALLLGESLNPFDVALSVEGETKDKKGQYQVALLVKLPMDKLVLLPRGGAHEGRVRLFVGAKDTEGRVSAINEIALPVRVPNEQILTAMTQSVATRVTLLLRPGEHTLVVGVRDEQGNTDSIVTGTYTAGSFADASKAAGAVDPAKTAEPVVRRPGSR
ncbi:MAG TPA: VWA domain-containing protein [Thermoanaerobaculia bacterium]|nr:VWA domain-containing protein [Thermoanaerobaculia bacterium]